jgi:hypothetical protein
MSQENIVETLKSLILNHNAKESDWTEAQKQVTEFLEEQARRKEEGKRNHERYTLEMNKPKNKFVELWNFRHVYGKELLEAFADELRKGEHCHIFRKGDSIEALTYLREQINSRKIADPNAEKIKLLREAKEELLENKRMIANAQTQIAETKKAAEDLSKKMTSGDPAKAKNYTV